MPLSDYCLYVTWTVGFSCPLKNDDRNHVDIAILITMQNSASALLSVKACSNIIFCAKFGDVERL